MKIAEIEKLKELIVSEKEGAEKELDQFITEKWNKAAENKRISQFYEIQFWFFSSCGNEQD